MSSMFGRGVLGALLLAALMGHGDGSGCCSSASSVFGPPTETECPPSSTLTYDNFGRDFMESYCTRCHDSAKTGAQRLGAPEFHDFDTLEGIFVVRDHIDETTASGPAATNEGMPPTVPKPTLEERQMLAEWIACGVPEN